MATYEIDGYAQLIALIYSSMHPVKPNFARFVYKTYVLLSWLQQLEAREDANKIKMD